MIQYRHKVQTALQILLPIVFSVCLIVIRSFIKPVVYPFNTTYTSFNPASLKPLRGIPASKTNIKEFRLVFSPKNNVLTEFLTNVSDSLSLEPPEGVESPEEVEKVMIERYLLCGVLFDDYNSSVIHFK